MSHQFTVKRDPLQREAWRVQYLEELGVPFSQDNPLTAYTAIALTNVSSILKPNLVKWQGNIKNALSEAAPDLNLTATPDQIYLTDVSRVASSRFFTLMAPFPSTGVGVEWQTAINLLSVPIILTLANVRVSRMQPPRSIILSLVNFSEDTAIITPIAEELQKYDIGWGTDEQGRQLLLGFDKTSAKIFSLEDIAYEIAPSSRYTYDGTLPVLKFSVENPEHLEV